MANNGRFISDLTIPDDTEIAAGTPFVKTWRVQNTGTTTWGEGYQLVFVNGVRMTAAQNIPLPVATPNQQVDISLSLTAPTTAGTYFGDWRLQDPQGNLFGQLIFLRIVVPTTAGLESRQGEGVSNGRYITDVTIPDGSLLKVGAKFTKTWRIENTGTTTWGAGYQLTYVEGEAMTANMSQPLAAAAPDEQVNASLSLTVPSQPGAYVSRWRLQDPQGRFFGDRLFLEINAVPQLNQAWSFLPDKWRPTIWAITSIFETGQPNGNIAAYQTVDNGIISYGKHQATLSSGNLNNVIQAYVALSNSPISQALRQEGYIERIAAKDESLRDDNRLRQLLTSAATDPAMGTAQDNVFAQGFYQPTIAQAQTYRLTSPLGVACLYDTLIQGGLFQLLPLTESQAGGKVGDQRPSGPVTEANWLRVFLAAREARLNRLADRHEADDNTVNAQALRISIFRVAALRELLIANNLGLEGTLMIRGHKIEGITH